MQPFVDFIFVNITLTLFLFLILLKSTSFKISHIISYDKTNTLSSFPFEKNSPLKISPGLYIL